MTHKPNNMASQAAKLSKLPVGMRIKIMSLAFGFNIKFFGTAGIRIDEIGTDRARMTIKNRKKVQNHIGTVHAAAMALLAESATGSLVGMNVPDDKLPLIKSMSLNYVKRATGDMYAEAWLSNEQLEAMHTQDKGEVTVAIKVTDEKGVEPVICEMIWAWVPRKRS